jgi:serine/threonine-protein kinase
VDVRGGILPPDKFYRQLAGVTPRRSGHLPVLEADSEPSTLEPGLEKVAVPAVLAANQKQLLTIAAITGGLVILLIACLLAGPKLFSPAPTATMSPTATLAFTDTPEPSPAPTQTSTPTAVFIPTITPTATLLPEIVDDAGVSMVLVPAGKFTMGSETGDANEKPVHQVYLDTFYIDKFEVTNARYRKCVLADKCKAPLQNVSYLRTDYYDSSQFDNYPVIFVNWDMARAYCAWRSARLPTEAEWEKAARGTDRRIYPWGGGIDNTYANYNQFVGDTTAVGSYENGKSSYGAYDMAGNVWEWVSDWFQDNYYITQGDNAVNPQGPKSGESRVLRGGSFYYRDYFARTANRGWSNPMDVGSGFGFRCAASVNP